MAQAPEETLKLLRALIGSADDGSLLTVEVIQHEGKLWLVPEWANTPNGLARTPVRVVRVDLLKHQQGPVIGHDLLIDQPIPTAVLLGLIRTTTTCEYEVWEAPPFAFLLEG